MWGFDKILHKIHKLNSFHFCKLRRKKSYDLFNNVSDELSKKLYTVSKIRMNSMWILETVRDGILWPKKFKIFLLKKSAKLLHKKIVIFYWNFFKLMNNDDI